MQIGVHLNDTEYAKRFCTYFHLNPRDNCQFQLISDLDQVKALADSGEIKALLITKEQYNKLQLELKDIHIVFLTDSRADMEDENTVFQYQNAAAIFDAVLEIIKRLTCKVQARSLVIAFAGAAGGAGTSSVLAGFGRYAAAKGRKVLCISAAYFVDDLRKYGPAAYDEIDFANMILSYREDPKMDIREFVEKKANKFIPAGEELKKEAALFELAPTKEETGLVLDKLANECGYDMLLLDTLLPYNDMYEQLLYKSDKKVLVHDGTEKANIISLFIGRHLKQGVFANMQLVYNKFIGGQSQTDEDSEFELIGGILYRRDTKEASIIDYISRLSMFEKIM